MFSMISFCSAQKRRRKARSKITRKVWSSHVKLKNKIKEEQCYGHFPDLRTAYSRQHTGDFILQRYPTNFSRRMVLFRKIPCRRNAMAIYHRASLNNSPATIARRVHLRSHSEQQLDNFGDHVSGVGGGYIYIKSQLTTRGTASYASSQPS